MARHGHFWSLASLPLPLPRPLPEKHDMERTSGSRTSGSARLEKQKPARLEGWDPLGHGADRRGVTRRGVRWLQHGRGSAWAQVLCACGSAGGADAGRSGRGAEVRSGRVKRERGAGFQTQADRRSLRAIWLTPRLRRLGFSGARRQLADGVFRLARCGGFRSAKATACRRGSSASDPRRRWLEGALGWLGYTTSQLLTRRGGWWRKFRRRGGAMVGGD
ncbi:hypothetical protein E6C27_scaffold57G002400 [Cucumis melo var. makuwa]|uniref:Uncharacterized protein n=1 Tax=Cucumis melo var. makuwa TaxID=1194695 RepID=A0A5A7T1B8_CUCMM|nr:hypothetical protein E6C27_scaffold57G002400 [Cucumis melo var. makuwa]